MNSGIRVRNKRTPVLGARSGVSLIETLMWSAVFSMLACVAYSVFFNAVRLSSLNAAALDRLRTVEAVRESFSKTVRQAAGIVVGVGSHNTGAEVVVLRMPPPAESPAAARYVVFGNVSGQGALARLEVTEDGGAFTASAFERYPIPANAIHLRYDANDPLQARRVSLEMEVANVVKGKAKPPVTYAFVAALRSGAGGAP